MISSTAFRMGRMAAPAVRRTFSTATVHASKSNYARNAMMATAGLAAAVTVLQEREVSTFELVEQNDPDRFAISLIQMLPFQYPFIPSTVLPVTTNER